MQVKKIIYNNFGDVEVLKMIDIDVPSFSEKEILIKVKAVSINGLDWKIRDGQMKMMTGSKFPRGTGIDFSGTVEDSGAAQVRYKVGDEVFGILDVFKGAALAEYIVVKEENITLKPSRITFEQAAALPVVGLAALQIFNKLVKISPNSKILINGASGGIGMIAIQIAKSRGAFVTAVTSDNGMSVAREWGSDRVISYKKADVLKDTERYDAFIDLSGRIPYKKAKIILKENSTYVNTVPEIKDMIVSLFQNLFSTRKYKNLFLKHNQNDLEELSKMAMEGLIINVDKIYNMSSFKEAFTQVPKGGINGKAVFIVGKH